MTRAGEKPARQKPDLSLVAFHSSMLTLTALIVPLIEDREAGWPLWAWLSLAAAPVLAVVFWRYETRLHLAGGTPSSTQPH